jgi:trimethylamine:corrinoid methyltransferase-like protein
MGKSIKSISDPGLHLDILSKEALDKIHQATLEIIEKTGVRFPSKRALEIWQANGRCGF